MDILQFDEDLLSFFNTIEINLVGYRTSINLMDLFPLIKKGISYKQTLYLLISAYINLNIKKDKNLHIVNEVLYKLSGKEIGSSITEGEIMDDVCAKVKTITKRVSRLLVLKLVKEKMIGCGVRSITNQTFKLYDAIDLIYSNNSNEGGYLYKSLFKHPKIDRLYYYVLSEDIDDINRELNLVDPRYDNFRIYFLAVKRGDKEIIKLVADVIINRTLLYKEILRIFFGSEDLINNIWVLTRNIF